MNEPVTITLDGNRLEVAEIVAIGRGTRQVALGATALQRCRRSRRLLEKQLAAGHVVYGVNTSFGPMCNKVINQEQLALLQENLLRSHAAGLGEALPPEIALGILAVRLNTLVKGYSGVRVELLDFLKELINRGIAPRIPECGSVGASGDLVHLAHMALPILGEGQVYYRGHWGPAAAALAAEGLAPLRLTSKEGLALINGTSAMTTIGAFALAGAQRLLNLSCVTAAMALEIFGGLDDAFDADLHRLKPHPGQAEVARIVRQLYHGSRNITERDGTHGRIRAQARGGAVFETTVSVQDVYSMRCTPQILAPVYETVQAVRRTLGVEANSSNDNPLVIPEKGKILHGGNFHGQSVGFAMDSLAMAMATMCTLSERRLNKLLDPKLNDGLPEQLIAGTPGLSLGFMGAQYVATSTTAENRHLANPVSTLSISCNASNQDVVSMGTVAARKALRAVSNAAHVLTVELLAQMQALSFRHAEGLGRGTQRIHQELSRHFRVYDNTRVFHDDLTQFRALLFETDLFDDLSVFVE
jgi:histidine ammonia-lyase